MLIRLVLTFAVTVLVSFALCPAVQAAVRLSSIFSDGMILQREKNVHVWGTASPGESVQVSIGGQRQTAIADAGGKWLVDLSPLKTGKPLVMTVQGTNTLSVKNILVGDVWICSGQSNMNFPLGASDFRGDAVSFHGNGSLRVFSVKPSVEGRFSDSYGAWCIPTPENVKSLPAIPVLMGRTLAKSKNMPVGIIVAACDGAPLESFMPPETIARTHNSELKLCAPHKLGANFQCRLLPLLHLTTQGIIWYQGESNLFSSATYRTGLPAFIEDIRARMKAPELPFVIVQLPNFGYRQPDNPPSDSFWADLREAQAQACRLKNVYMAVAIDTAGEGIPSLHPPEKTILSQRIASIAEKLEDSVPLLPPPVVKAQRVERDSIFLSFKNLGGPLATVDKGAVRGFQLAGSDHVFHWAGAEICGNEVKVTSDDVIVPVAVRYAWADNPDCNLCSGGMPFPPFRTDNWASKPKLNPSCKPTLVSR